MTPFLGFHGLMQLLGWADCYIFLQIKAIQALDILVIKIYTGRILLWHLTRV